jgi:hypothetical protein
LDDTFFFWRPNALDLAFGLYTGVSHDDAAAAFSDALGAERTTFTLVY